MILSELVSIIVPVYNTERYLEECLESIQKQSYKNIECILINDGSTDNSKEICKKFCKMDSRFQLIDKSNEGVSIARNIGIKKSIGKYIQFTDSDDVLDANMIERLVERIKNDESECVICGIKSFVDNTSKEINHWHENDCVLSKSDFVKNIAYWTVNPYIGGPYNKLFDRNVIKNNALQYEVNQSYGEDIVFNFSYFEKIEKISIISDELYFYRRNNPNSLTKEKRKFEGYAERSAQISATLSKLLEKIPNSSDILICFNYDLIFRILKKFSSTINRKKLTEFLKKQNDELLRNKKNVVLPTIYLRLFKKILDLNFYTLAILYVELITSIYLIALRLKSQTGKLQEPAHADR